MLKLQKVTLQLGCMNFPLLLRFIHHMKIFAFILSMLVMWLTTIPCIDLPKDNTLHKIEISKQNQNTRHQDTTDHCSPFSTCNCCQSNFDITHFVLTPLTGASDINYYDFAPNFKSPAIFDFQVPPKA
jgi:hypothetical protein